MIYRNYEHDVFICHASEDKEAIADELTASLEKLGLNVWYDEHFIFIGDSKNQKVHEGLKKSRVGVLIFSKSFFDPKKTWPQRELSAFLYKKNEGEAVLLPLFYEIDAVEVIKRFPEFDDIKELCVDKKKLPKVAKAIFNKVNDIKRIEEQEKKKLVKEKSKKRNEKIFWITLILLLVLAVIFLFFRDPPPNKKEPIQGSNKNNSDTVIRTVFVPTQTPKSRNEKISDNSEKPQKESVDRDDYNSYVNSSLLNSNHNMEVFVTIIDERMNNIETSVSSAIADVYTKAGKRGNTGLLRSTFIKKSEFQELFEGNSDIIEKLKLNAFTDHLALGKLHYSFRPGTLVDGTIVCSASITMSIISTSSKSVSQSFTVSANGNGVTESQAQEYALQNLLSKYYSEHSSL